MCCTEIRNVNDFLHPRPTINSANMEACTILFVRKVENPDKQKECILNGHWLRYNF